MFNDDESLLEQLTTDLKAEFAAHEEYKDITIKSSYEDYPVIKYPLVLLYEIENSAVSKFYDLQEHIVNVSYQIIVYAKETANYTATDNVRNIMGIIRDYMRGERYHSLKRLGNTPITKKQDDENVRIGYMRYVGQIDIDNHIIYRRN